MVWFPNLKCERTPRGRVNRAAHRDDEGVRVSPVRLGGDAQQELAKRQQQRLRELRDEKAKLAKEAETMSALSKKVDAEVDRWAAKKKLPELLRTIGQVWPAAAAKVAQAGSTKKAYMQVLRLVHPDKVASGAPLHVKAKAQRIFTVLQSRKPE